MMWIPPADTDDQAKAYQDDLTRVADTTARMHLSIPGLPSEASMRRCAAAALGVINACRNAQYQLGEREVVGLALVIYQKAVEKGL